MTASIEYALGADGVFYLRLSGELRHTLCCPLDSLLESLFETDPPQVRSVVIDLSQASFMDSTMIGLLAGIARELQRHGLPQATVFSTHPEIDQLLHCLCLDQVFTVVHQSTAQALDLELLAAERQASAAVDADPRHTAAVILKAHEALIGVDEANRPAFQPVVDLFREQLDQRKH